MTPFQIRTIVAVVLAVVILRFVVWGLLVLSMRLTGGLISQEGYGRRAWARTKPVRRWGKSRFPRLYEFIAARLDPHRFAGLPLTLIAAAALYAAFLFGGLLENVVERDAIVRIDQDVNAALSPLRSDALLDAFLWITDLGSGPAFVAVAIVATGFLWADRRPAFILPLWVTLVGARATTYVGKLLVARPRPEFLDVAQEASASFPSGHATAAAALYGFLAFAMARDLDALGPAAFRHRFELAYWTCVLIALVGFSRMFLSVHYLSDVLAGFLVGGFWLLVGVALTEWLRGRVRM
jgi:undecaprenyl-diphosphatase